MKVSIIIPAYNAEKTLPRCLDSIINQTYQNLEILLINDGSTDSTQDICENYKKLDKRIILIDKPNSGVSNTRNRGIEKSTGDYVTFIDSDDTLELNCIETLVQNVQKDIDFIRYNFNSIGKTTFNDNLFDLANQKIDITSNRDKIFKHFLTAENSIPNLIFLLFIRKDIIKKIRFNEKLFMMEDVEFYFNLFKNSSIAKFIDCKMYNYYNNPESVTHNPENFKKLIYGILNTNEVLNQECKELVNENIIKNMNASHLSIISQYIINICKIDKNSSKEEIKKLKTDTHFKLIINNSNLKSIPLKNQILLNLIKKDHSTILNFYLSILKILYKIKD